MPKKTYYVYELSDPRNGETFYIGKGTGDRCLQHATEAKTGKNNAKCRRIRDIQATGQCYRITFAKQFATEQAAYDFEKRHILKHGLHKLTNMCPGGRWEWEAKSDPDITRIQALAILAKKTAGLTVCPSMLLGQQWHDVEANADGKFLINMRKAVGNLVYQRGVNWVNKQLKKYNCVLGPQV